MSYRVNKNIPFIFNKKGSLISKKAKIYELKIFTSQHY